MELGRLSIDALLAAVGVIITATVFAVSFANLRLSAHRDQHRAEDQRLQDELQRGEGGWSAFRLISAHFEAAALDPIAMATIRVANILSAVLVLVTVAYIATRTGDWTVAEITAVAVGPVVQAAVAGLGMQETRALRRSIVDTLNDLLVDILSYRHPLIDDERSWFGIQATTAERAVITRTLAAAAKLKDRGRLPMVPVFEAVAATAAGDWPRAKLLADQCVATLPDEPAALTTAAAVYLHAAQANVPDHDAAALTAQAIHIAERLDPGNARFDVAGVTRLLSRGADLLARLEPTPENIFGALDAYEAAIGCDPDNVLLRLNRAYLVEPLHDALAPPLDPVPVETMWALRTVSDLDVLLETRDDVGARELRGVALACLGDWEAAAAEFMRVAERSGWGDGTYHVAALTMAGRFEEAVVGVEKIRLRGPGAGADVQAEASFWLALAESQLDDGSAEVVAAALADADWTQDRADLIDALIAATTLNRTDVLDKAIAALPPPAPAADRLTRGGLLRQTVPA